MTEVVIGAKTMHVGALHGHISNAGGTIKVNDWLAIKIVGIAEKFRQIQVVVSDTGEPIRGKQWEKTKTVARPKNEKLTQVDLVEEADVEDIL